MKNKEASLEALENIVDLAYDFSFECHSTIREHLIDLDNSAETIKNFILHSKETPE